MYTAPVKVNHQLNQPVQAQFPVLVKIPDPVLTPTLTRVLISEPHTNQSGSQATVSSTPVVNYPTRKGFVLSLQVTLKNGVLEGSLERQSES